MPRRVRINRGERRTPFLSNLVKGTQDQLTPNGCAYNGPWPELNGKMGAGPPMRQEPEEWPGANRSGE